MNKYGVKKIVFSSTAATYGEPESVPILETDKTVTYKPLWRDKTSCRKNAQMG